MRNAATVTLPGGVWLDGMRHQEAGLRPLTGEDEAFLVEVGASLLPARLVTALLARCLMHIGPLDAVSAEFVRSLTVGDREALLLHLRRLTLGERMECVLSCPQTDCGEKLDLTLGASDLLVPVYADAREWYERPVAENGDVYQVRFRLPTGADQEAAASLVRDDPQAAADLMLHRCVERVTRNGDDESITDWPAAISQQVPALMAELDAQAELVLNLTCPACERTFPATFDTAAYFFRELAHRASRLHQEVHLLALYYHWSEADILSLTAKRRQRYVEVLVDAMAKERGK
jgi:hypothetical protein